ncbi:MAG TPA: hypothetical protein VKE70_26045 [Candidatus Solibacter sp.]|nr:hypothetical protein [Candidatus Solibacter sp.]
MFTLEDQRRAVVGLTGGLLTFGIIRFFLDPAPLNALSIVPLSVFVATALSLRGLVSRRNWARRTLLVVTSWSGTILAILALRLANVVLIVVAIATLAIFVWLMLPVNRAQFTSTPRTWGFARATFGAAILLSSIKSLIAPSEGPIPLLKASSEAEAAGMVVGRLVGVAVAVWLLWTGIQKERRLGS